MALLLPKSAFIHVPKCGGSSVRLALTRAGYSVRREDETGPHGLPFNRRAHAKWAQVRELIGERTPFTFVREPLGWYGSYWKHRTKFAWTLPQYEEEREAWGGGLSFPVWVRRVTDLCPGFLFKLYEECCGAPGEVWVGKTSDLQSDLRYFLRAAGESVCDVSVGHDNAIDEPVEMTGELSGLILASEAATVERYGFYD